MYLQFFITFYVLQHFLALFLPEKSAHCFLFNKYFTI